MGVGVHGLTHFAILCCCCCCVSQEYLPNEQMYVNWLSVVSDTDEKAASLICCECSCGWRIHSGTGDEGRDNLLTVQLFAATVFLLTRPPPKQVRWFSLKLTVASFVTVRQPDTSLTHSSSCFVGISMRAMLELKQSTERLRGLPWFFCLWRAHRKAAFSGFRKFLSSWYVQSIGAMLENSCFTASWFSLFQDIQVCDPILPSDVRIDFRLCMLNCSSCFEYLSKLVRDRCLYLRC